MKDNTMRSIFNKNLMLLLILAMIVSVMPSMIVSATNHNLDTDEYHTDDGKPVYEIIDFTLEKNQYPFTGIRFNIRQKRV